MADLTPFVSGREKRKMADLTPFVSFFSLSCRSTSWAEGVRHPDGGGSPTQRTRSEIRRYLKDL